MNWLRSGLEFAKDVQAFGVAAASVSMQRVAGRGTFRIHLKSVGHLKLRCRDSDYATIRQIFRDEEFRVHSAPARDRITARYNQIIASGGLPVIVDAGANIGAAAMWFKKLYPHAMIVAVEPDPDNAALLRENVSPFSQIVVMEAAIGANPGFVELTQSGESWATQTVRSSSGYPMISINEIISEIPGGALFIVKIDIEGFEQDLFEANLEWIDQTTAIFIEPHDWLFPGRHTSQNFQRAMGSRNFEIFLHGENITYVRLGEEPA